MWQVFIQNDGFTRSSPMTFTLYEASAPAFLHGLAAVEAWLDKALAEGGDEAALMAARLAPDMKPFPGQIQLASDTAKGAIARLTGTRRPPCPTPRAVSPS